MKRASCYRAKNGTKPAGSLNLDDDDRRHGADLPGSYAAIATQPGNEIPTTGAITPDGRWLDPQKSRYISAGQSRQSRLIWKLFGKRLDGQRN